MTAPAAPPLPPELDAWMAAAKLDGAAPLLAIDHSLTPGKLNSKPDATRYRALVRWLRTRYPWWNTLTPWNEANFRLQPTYRNPVLAASYWKIAKKMYPGDTKNGVEKIQEANKDAIGGKPLKIGQVLVIPQ